MQIHLEFKEVKFQFLEKMDARRSAFASWFSVFLYVLSLIMNLIYKVLILSPGLGRAFVWKSFSGGTLESMFE